MKHPEKPRPFRAAMTWMHTWSGLLLGWVLFAIFVTGTASYFRPEITAWMRPELPPQIPAAQAARVALARLHETAPDARRWLVDVPDSRDPELTLRWQPAAPGARFQSEVIDVATGQETAARATYGGEFFYRFHFQLMLPHPWGRYTACLAAAFMLVALVSGVITHRRFSQDLFLLRLGRDGRRPWLDFHNVTAVVALPFYLMISYSALVIFIPLVMPWAAKALAPAKAAAATVSAAAAIPPSPGDPVWVGPAALERALATAVATWGGQRSIRRLDVADRGTPEASITLTRADGPAVSTHQRETLRFSGLTGEPARPPAEAAGLATRIRGYFYGLHMARFAGPLLRGLFFGLGLLGAGMIGSGLVLWTLKRRERLATAGAWGNFGYGVVARLNLVFIAGFPAACAAFLWGNRLLPLDLAERADRELLVFLGAWAASLLHASLRGASTRAWREQLAAAALLFAGLPALDLLTAGRELGPLWPRFDGHYAGFGAALIFIGFLFACAARRTGLPPTRRATAAQPRRGAVPEEAPV